MDNNDMDEDANDEVMPHQPWMKLGSHNHKRID